MPTVEEDRAITAAAKNDPDAQPLTSKQLKAMVPLRSLRGRPKSENKKLLVSVRYSPEVVEYFRSKVRRLAIANGTACFASMWHAMAERMMRALPRFSPQGPRARAETFPAAAVVSGTNLDMRI